MIVIINAPAGDSRNSRIKNVKSWLESKAKIKVSFF